MIIDYDLRGDLADALVTTLNLAQFSQHSDTDVLMYGINSCLNIALQEKYKHYKRRSFYDVFSPCAMYTRTRPGNFNYMQLTNFFNDIYCTCPYTAEWCNKFHENKFRYFASAFNLTLLQPTRPKIHDVCYFGSIHSRELLECINIISKFNYRFMSQMVMPADHGCGKITNPRMTTQNKIKLVSQCKIGVCYNLLYLTPPQQQEFLSYNNIEHHGAYQGLLDSQHLDRANLPQFKIRCHECAASKTLILCKRDPWNVIETMYTPDEDFVYFDDNSELEQKIKDILANWDHFQNIANNAYNKLLKYYLTSRFYECAKAGLTNLITE